MKKKLEIIQFFIILRIKCKSVFTRKFVLTQGFMGQKQSQNNRVFMLIFVFLTIAVFAKSCSVCLISVLRNVHLYLVNYLPISLNKSWILVHVTSLILVKSKCLENLPKLWNIWKHCWHCWHCMELIMLVYMNIQHSNDFLTIFLFRTRTYVSCC